MFNKHKLDKKFFNFIINLCQSIQVVLIFLSFFVILYWILSICNVSLNPVIINFFEAIRTFTHCFYKRTVLISGKEIDFSFLVATFLFLSLVWFLRLFIESIIDFEDKYFSVKLSVEKKAEDIFNKNLENEYKNQEIKNDKVIFLIKFKAEKIKKIELFRNEEKNAEENKQIENSAANDFYSVAEKYFPKQIKNLNGTIIIYFEQFSKVNLLLPKMEKYMSDLIKEYYNQGWELAIIRGLDAYGKPSEIVLKAEILKKLLNVFTTSETACLSSFRQRYSLQKEQIYEFESVGLYRIEENEEVYKLKKIK